MVNLICVGGVLDGKKIAHPNNVYEFEVEDFNSGDRQKYVRFTMPDGFGNYVSEWRYRPDIFGSK